MSTIKTSRTIHAPISMVFDTVSDVRNFSKAVPDIKNIEFLSDIKEGTGTRFRETREMNGREATTELEITEYEKNDYVRIVSDTNGTIWDSLFYVEQKDRATKLTLEMEAKAYKLLPKILNPVLKMFIKKALENDMDAVKQYCEQ